MKRVALGAACAALWSVVAFSSPSVAADPPQFQVDALWPKPLPQQLDLRPGGERRHGFERPCLGAAAPALAHRGRERRHAQAAAQQVLRTRSVGHGVRCRRQLHPGLGRPRNQAVGHQRARHPCRPQGLRLDRRQRRDRQRHLQIHQGRQAGADDRQARPDRRQQRQDPVRPARRHRGRRPMPTRSTSPTATATVASS